jgi:hypothetical protein
VETLSLSCINIPIQQFLKWSTVMGFDASVVMSGNQLVNDTSLTRVMEFGDSSGVSQIINVLVLTTIFAISSFVR